MDLYTVWITINIRHDYFVTNKNYINLEPLPDTDVLLRKAGILLKKGNGSTWMLLKKEDQNEIMFEDLYTGLEFGLKNADPDFYYYTEDKEISNEPAWKTEHIGKSGVWKTLGISVDKNILREKITIDINIDSRKRYMEFLIIPKSGSLETVELREDNDKLVFSRSQVNDFPGEAKAYRFITTEAVALRELYNYKIGLWEIKENGENLLSSTVRFPKASALSVTNSKNTISSYFYF